ncbi:hypothetical protein [Kitasatospora sp. NPDC058478]|uniref:hypothetical protein n=1 Tax=unclassified Kitasatospora TaxID=2633591 RepID=UPI003667E718
MTSSSLPSLTSTARTAESWVIRAVDVSRPFSPGGNTVVPDTEYLAANEAEALEYLPEIRQIAIDYAGAHAVPLFLVQIVAIGYQGVRVARTALYPVQDAGLPVDSRFAATA